MTNKEIKSIKSRIVGFLRERRLRDALVELEKATKKEMFFELTDLVDRQRQTYSYMLAYLTSGADDPQREVMLNDIVAECYRIADNYEVRAMAKEIPTLYYNIRRYNERQGAKVAIGTLIDNLNAARSRASSLSSLMADASQKDSGLRTTVESAETSLFNAVWASFPLKKEDSRRLVELITADGTPFVTACRLASALMLAALEFADEETLCALADIYTLESGKDGDTARAISVVALTGLVIAMFKYGDRTFSRTFRNRMAALSELPDWNSDVRTLFIELVRARDTERISRAITNEIYPGMMALRPEIEKKIKELKDEDASPEDIANNPEWEELLAKSKIGDKIKEINELQMEGSDIFMSTFSHLKQFPFFNEAVNWFTPFDDANPEIDRIITSNPEMAGVVEIVKDLVFLCDSDKLSIVLSLNMVPDANRMGALNGVMAQRDRMKEMMAEYNGITRRDERKVAIRNYLRNFYRFVNLFRRKSEFYNVFTDKLDFSSAIAISDVLSDPDVIRMAGEMYFRQHNYTDALSLFGVLDDMGEFDATLYQKMGYAYEKCGDTENALRYYEQADLLDGSSRWLKLRLAHTYRANRRYAEAIDLLTDLAAEYPEDVEIALMTGYVYISADNYREALKHFFKAEFLSPDDSKVVRPIAWSLLMVREFDRASSYYAKLLMHSPTAEDYLNMGHAALAKSDFKEAINYYKMFILNSKGDKETFFKAIETDRQHLLRAGIDNSVISLIADSMLYELERQGSSLI